MKPGRKPGSSKRCFALYDGNDYGNDITGFETSERHSFQVSDWFCGDCSLEVIQLYIVIPSGVISHGINRGWKIQELNGDFNGKPRDFPGIPGKWQPSGWCSAWRKLGIATPKKHVMVIFHGEFSWDIHGMLMEYPWIILEVILSNCGLNGGLFFLREWWQKVCCPTWRMKDSLVMKHGWDIPELCHCALLGKSSKSVGDFLKCYGLMTAGWMTDCGSPWEIYGNHGPFGLMIFFWRIRQMVIFFTKARLGIPGLGLSRAVVKHQPLESLGLMTPWTISQDECSSPKGASNGPSFLPCCIIELIYWRISGAIVAWVFHTFGWES